MSDVNIEYVDAHCHLDLYPDPLAMMRKIEERRVHTIAVTNAPSVFEQTERLVARSRYLHAAAGLHPELVATHSGELNQLWPFLDRTSYVGEVGLDYSISDVAIRTKQRQVFGTILERCATYKNKTITVHSRRAASDTIDAIGAKFPGKVILHWFTGTRREVERAAQDGIYFSINPAMVTSQRGRELIDAMPRDRVLTESDGPFVRLGPQPADPTSAPIALNYLSRTWRISVDEVAQTVLRNLERPCAG
jgi:TatD DNase family protein